MNPWQPITSKQDLARLGKAVEELGELQQALGRCIIQGLDEAHPVTGKINRDWLAEEIPDVEAMLEMVKHRFLDDRRAEMRKRSAIKIAHLLEWFRTITG